MHGVGPLKHSIAILSPSSEEHRDATALANPTTGVWGSDDGPGLPYQFTPIGFATTERVQMMIAQRLISLGRDYTGLENGGRHYTAIRLDNGVWVVADNNRAEPRLAIANGNYMFVRMMSGEIRVGCGSDGHNYHGELSGCAAYVAYAGYVTFNQGKVVEFSNASGTYRPSAELRLQSGFDHDARFNAQ
ncbi:hypothetical protein [Cupriavidus pampae]|uniref:Uncharacterized protein n=1 Tax=Cupriavidus pampae TaxID=659251 RepID=A0ABM8XZJ9_9BURK|nr:hypothetical protein [Cupriavidus pampae]CAG9185890.1 hypothetical protein LMG32289_06146 [Cupriavidus pampae]